jgi:hypothetical protein
MIYQKTVSRVASNSGVCRYARASVRYASLQIRRCLDLHEIAEESSREAPTSRASASQKRKREDDDDEDESRLLSLIKRVIVSIAICVDYLVLFAEDGFHVSGRADFTRNPTQPQPVYVRLLKPRPGLRVMGSPPTRTSCLDS